MLFARAPWPALLTGLLLMLAGTGCGTVNPSAAKFASVTIQNKSRDKIIATAVKVFDAEGFVGGWKGSGLVFEKESSAGTSLSREGLASTYYGAHTVDRVVMEIVRLSASSYKLQCQAYVVRNAGDSFFEDAAPVSRMRSGPYRELLEKIAQQLQ
jgi:hypothetical protein